jgi:D-glycero-alpha-D-manno-heptose-7-phosphate kinase
MLLTRTPLRMSLFGGGSDIPEFYLNHATGGTCLSFTIDKYIYLAVNHCVASHIKAVYSELELVNDVNDIKHDRIREILKYYGIDSNIEITSFSDIPVKGTGLGSSSAFTVGLIKAIHWLKYQEQISPRNLAELACYIEIEKCGEPIGKQDQYATAFGGFNLFSFRPSGHVDIQRPAMSTDDVKTMFDNLFCYYTGITRNSADVLREQTKKIKYSDSRIMGILHKMAVDANKVGLFNEYSLDKDIGVNQSIGNKLHNAWMMKRDISDNISNLVIDEMYDRGIQSGAQGGKLLGAGAGGYILFYVLPKDQPRFIKQMEEAQYSRFFFTPTVKGSEIVFNGDDDMEAY